MGGARQCTNKTWYPCWQEQADRWGSPVCQMGPRDAVISTRWLRTSADPEVRPLLHPDGCSPTPRRLLLEMLCQLLVHTGAPRKLQIVPWRPHLELIKESRPDPARPNSIPPVLFGRLDGRLLIALPLPLLGLRFRVPNCLAVRSIR